MIELNLIRDVMDSICRSRVPGPSVLDPIHTTFLKLVDEYAESRLREDSTKLPISFDSTIFLTKVIGKLVCRAPIILSPVLRNSAGDETTLQAPADQISLFQRLDHIETDRNGLSQLLRIMSRLSIVMTPKEKCRLMLKGLVESILNLLKIADELLPRKRGLGIVSEGTTSTALCQGLHRFKVNLVSVLGNLCASNREVQDEIRRLGGIPLILAQAHIDDCNPCTCLEFPKISSQASKRTDTLPHTSFERVYHFGNTKSS